MNFIFLVTDYEKKLATHSKIMTIYQHKLEQAKKQLEAEKKRREAQAPYRPTALELQNLRNASALRSGSNGDD